MPRGIFISCFFFLTMTEYLAGKKLREGFWGSQIHEGKSRAVVGVGPLSIRWKLAAQLAHLSVQQRARRTGLEPARIQPIKEHPRYLTTSTSTSSPQGCTASPNRAIIFWSRVGLEPRPGLHSRLLTDICE